MLTYTPHSSQLGKLQKSSYAQLSPHPGHWGADHGRGMGKEPHFIPPVLGGASWQAVCREVTWIPLGHTGGSPSTEDRDHRLGETFHPRPQLLTKLTCCQSIPPGYLFQVLRGQKHKEESEIKGKGATNSKPHRP